MFVGQHVDPALHCHSKSKKLVVEGGGAEEGGAFGVRNLVAGDEGFGSHFDGVIVEFLEGYGV